MESKKIFMKNKQILWWCVPFLAALAVVLPLLLKEGIPFGNDASFHLSRVVSIAEGLKNGIFLPGPVKNNSFNLFHQYGLLCVLF